MFDKSKLDNLVKLKSVIFLSEEPSSIRDKLQKQLVKDSVITIKELKNFARNSAILQQRLSNIGPYQNESDKLWSERIRVFFDSYIDILSIISYDFEKIDSIIKDKEVSGNYDKMQVNQYINNLRVLIDNFKINHKDIDKIRKDILYNHIIPNIITEEEFKNYHKKLKELTGEIKEKKKKLRILSFDTEIEHPTPWRYLVNLLFAFSYKEDEFHKRLDETLKRTLDKGIVDALTRQEVLIEIIRYEDKDINRLRTAKLQFLTKTLTRDKRYFNLLLDIFKREDYLEIYDKKIGIKGSMGGKVTGIFVANKILREELKDDYEKYFDNPKYFVMDTKEYVDFINYNKLHETQGIRWEVEEALSSQDPEKINKVKKKLERFQKRILEGKFPPKTESHLRMLYEETFTKGRPIIARSSSYLEDNYNTPFAGKYFSVFIPNSSENEDKNFEDMLTAAKTVYSSILNFEAMMYRYESNLFIEEEEMAIAFQEVVGKKRGGLFSPLFSGVIYSRAPRAFSSIFNLSQGFIEIVLGLGTRVVDQADYTRMVYFSHPSLSPSISLNKKLKYSQKGIDVIDLESNKYSKLSMNEWISRIITDSKAQKEIKKLKLLHEDTDGILMPVLLFDDKKEYIVSLDTFFNEKQISNTLINLLKKSKDILKKKFEFDIDIEFAVEYYEDKSGNLIPRINILQCRPQYFRQAFSPASMPENIDEEDILYKSYHPMLDGHVKDIEYMLYVDLNSYGSFNPDEITELKNLIKKLNLELKDKNLVLMGPGRWGSSNRSLGIPVVYSEINNVKALIELGIERHTGDVPELSYGSHFFQDIDRAGIHVIPMLVFTSHNVTYYNEKIIKSAKNRLKKYPQFKKFSEKGVKLIHFPSSFNDKHLSIYMNHTCKEAPNILMVLEK